MKYSETILKQLKQIISTDSNYQEPDKKKITIFKYLDNFYNQKEEDILTYFLNKYGNLKDKESLDYQKKDLQSWLYYLNSLEYPNYFKHLILSSILSIGSYDIKKEEYHKRDNTTKSSFIMLDEEAISYIYDCFLTKFKEETINNKEIDILLKEVNISKLYLRKLKENQSSKITNDTIGIWKKYHEGNKKDAQDLKTSLYHKHTGWCTERQDFAYYQVCGYLDVPGGDFHVYYTKDKDGEFTIPRIAIRMEKDNKIVEIRGICHDQNLESGLEDIVIDKLKELNISEKSLNIQKNKLLNAKRVVEIKNNILKNNITEEDISFIFELDKKIIGFGEQEEYNEELITPVRKDILKHINLSKEMYEKIFIKDSYNFHLLEESLPNYQDLALLAVKSNSKTLKYVPKNLSNYYEIAKEAVSKEGHLIKIVPIDLPNYQELALLAVKNNGYALEDIPSNLENYQEIIQAAIKETTAALEYVSPDNPHYQEIVLMTIRESEGFVLRKLSEETIGYENILKFALEENPHYIKFIPKEYPKRKKYELMSEMLKIKAFLNKNKQKTNKKVKNDKLR